MRASIYGVGAHRWIAPPDPTVVVRPTAVVQQGPLESGRWRCRPNAAGSRAYHRDRWCRAATVSRRIATAGSLLYEAFHGCPIRPEHRAAVRSGARCAAKWQATERRHVGCRGSRRYSVAHSRRNRFGREAHCQTDETQPRFDTSIIADSTCGISSPFQHREVVPTTSPLRRQTLKASHFVTTTFGLQARIPHFGTGLRARREPMRLLR